MTLKDITLSTIRSGKGDCIHLRYNGHNIIVDSGPTSSAGAFRSLCDAIIATGESLDTLIITHYDDDHIGGILKVDDPGFREFYFNAYDGVFENGNLSAIQNQRLFRILPESIVHSSVVAGDCIELGGARLWIHAPTESDLSKTEEKMKEADTQLGAVSDWSFSLDELAKKDYPSPDTSVSNKSSIVFSFEYGDSKILFAGDASADSIPAGSYDIVKLPHHGSARNISDDLITRLNTNKFLICADGTRHPNKQTVAKLLNIKEKITIYSNYDWWMKGFIGKEDMKYINDGKLEFILI